MPATIDHPPPTPELLYLLHGDPADLAVALSGMRAADIAEELRHLTPPAAAKVLAALPFDMAVQVFDEPELAERRVDIVRQVDEGVVGPLVDAMSADQQADLFRELPEAERQALLERVDQPTRDALELLLRYPPDTAGGIMTTEFVAMPATWTVAEALAYVREVGSAKETIYLSFVLDPATQRLVHVVSLRQLLQAPSDVRVADVGDRRAPLVVTPRTPREDVARLVSKYNLLAVPVIDEGRHVLGIVTVDDIIDAIVREQTEDVQRFGGMEALDVPYTEISFGRMIRKRAGWLCALFLSEMLTATAMQRFEGEIAKAVVLSMFIPLVMSSGGNSGSQATSLIIRALALREVKLRDWWRIALRELPTGVTLGTILGVIGFTRIELWQRLHLFDYGPHHLLVAITVGFALVGIVGFGSLAGSMLPFLLKRLGFDPASASAPFVATLVDVTGLVIYFSVALLVLRGTLL
jgi:magnesium transporter